MMGSHEMPVAGRATYALAVVVALLMLCATAQGSSAAVSMAASNALPVWSTNHLRLEFRNAPLDRVLEHLSDAAGFIINQEAQVSGTVDIWSKEPVSRDEAVELLNSALRKNGYAVVRSGRILTVVRPSEAKTSDLDVIAGNNPDGVEKSEEVITYVIPVRHANAPQLVSNLVPLLPTSASLTVNESANSLILVATSRDVRRVLRITKVLDDALASVSSIKVIGLRYADAQQVATALQQLYAPPTSTGRRSDQTQAGGGLSGPGGQAPGDSFPTALGGFLSGVPSGNAGTGQGAQASSGSGNAARGRVAIAADESSNSLIVSAPHYAVASITNIVAQLDRPVSDITDVRVFRLENADVTDTAEQLAQLFPNDTRSGTEQARGPVQFGVSPFSGGLGEGTPGAFGSFPGTSERARKAEQVLAVPDPRSSSLVVRAPSSLMPRIAELMANLDAQRGHKETVQIFQLHNARPTQVEQVLRDLFNRNNTMRNSTTPQEDEDALALRQQQQSNLGLGGGNGLELGGQGEGTDAGGGGFQP